MFIIQVVVFIGSFVCTDEVLPHSFTENSHSEMIVGGVWLDMWIFFRGTCNGTLRLCDCGGFWLQHYRSVFLFREQLE